MLSTIRLQPNFQHRTFPGDALCLNNNTLQKNNNCFECPYSTLNYCHLFLILKGNLSCFLKHPKKSKRGRTNRISKDTIVVGYFF